MILALENIKKKFDDRTVINDFSYHFKDRGVVALTGPSGVGKTTLLKIILGLDKKIKGERIVADGVKFSAAFQEHRLLPHLSALKNVVTFAFDSPSDEQIDKAKKLLIHFGFSDDEMNLYPAELSGGMKQRVSLVRAFMRECDVLILDEPTKELDAQLVKTVLEYIKKFSENKLVITVSHVISDVEFLDADVIELK